MSLESFCVFTFGLFILAVVTAVGGDHYGARNFGMLKAWFYLVAVLGFERFLDRNKDR